jgi:hypothetical protein
MPLAAVLSLVLAGFADSQVHGLEDLEPSGSVKLTGGLRTGQVDLRPSEAPSPGDLIGVATDLRGLQIVLITPEGRKVAAGSAAAEGFGWHEEDDIHLGVYPQPGRLTKITFSKPGVAGKYTVRFTADSVQGTAKVSAWFSRLTPTLQSYRLLVHDLPGAQMPDSAALAPSAILRFELGRDETLAFFDVAVPDSATTVTLALPGGRLLRQDQADQNAVTWSNFSYRGPSDQPVSGLGPLAGFVLPVKGYHHAGSRPAPAEGSGNYRRLHAHGN